MEGGKPVRNQLASSVPSLTSANLPTVQDIQVLRNILAVVIEGGFARWDAGCCRTRLGAPVPQILLVS